MHGFDTYQMINDGGGEFCESFLSCARDDIVERTESMVGYLPSP